MYLADWWLLLLLISGRGHFLDADLRHKGLWGIQVSEDVVCGGIRKMSHQCGEALDEGY